MKRKQIPKNTISKWPDDYRHEYWIPAEHSVTLVDGVHGYWARTCTYRPGKLIDDEALQLCRRIWNELIVPETSVEGSNVLPFRYSIWHDWGTGGIEVSEYRYCDALIRFDLRYKEPRRLYSASSQRVFIPHGWAHFVRHDRLQNRD